MRPPASLTHRHTDTHWHFQPPMARGDDKETEGPCLAEPLPAPSTYCTAPYLTPEPYCISIPSLAVCWHGLHTNRVCVMSVECSIEIPSPPCLSSKTHKCVSSYLNHECADTHYHSHYNTNQSNDALTPPHIHTNKHTQSSPLICLNCLSAIRGPTTCGPLSPWFS